MADDVVLVAVIDNGRGIEIDPARSVGHGLTNLRHRAEKLSGTFEILSVDGGGTRLNWSAPL